MTYLLKTTRKRDVGWSPTATDLTAALATALFIFCALRTEPQRCRVEMVWYRSLCHERIQYLCEAEQRCNHWLAKEKHSRKIKSHYTSFGVSRVVCERPSPPTIHQTATRLHRRIQDFFLGRGSRTSSSGCVLAAPVAHAETFHGEFQSLAYGGRLYLVCVVCDVPIWRHIHVSKPAFWWNYLI